MKNHGHGRMGFNHYWIFLSTRYTEAMELYLLAVGNFAHLHLLEEINNELDTLQGIIIGKYLSSLFYYKDII